MALSRKACCPNQLLKREFRNYFFYLFFDRKSRILRLRRPQAIDIDKSSTETGSIQEARPSTRTSSQTGSRTGSRTGSAIPETVRTSYDMITSRSNESGDVTINKLGMM